ncbi:hypothetical protein PLIIFM63780_006947 [Purpureocillium lilacinum]|uniref:uncharacterized protein n=1 Tax=Purpureocillium lilacinum TaxID=33203 RepID=UPI00208A94B5|nr:hypothetical protein PLICBS_006957 [Purpureocillium lilacinum]GJN83398.1 hypothetical protein PLIIFM63780_006947 [Purpureocillium lilacinum]
MRKAADAKTRRASPPTASYMSNDQFASYLSELRANRTTRPGGARPLPSQLSRASTGRYSLGGASAQDAAINDASHQRTPSQAPSVAAASIRSRLSTSSGRDYYPATPTAPLKPSDVVPTRTYMERGQRWMEKEEAVSLRDAMEEMDIRSGAQDGSGSGSGSDDETRLYNAALDEAAELVWQHQNGVVPRPPDGPYRYRPHLRKNSYAHARTASIGADSDDIAPSGLRRDMGSRSVSGSSTGSDDSSYAPRHSLDSNQCAGNRKQKPYGSVGAHNRRTSLKRNISGEVERPFSGDQIWEEPEVSGGSEGVASGRASPNKLSNKPPNPVSSSRFFPSRDAAAQVKPLNRVDIYRNPPTQTRNAQYTRNTPSPGPGPTPDPSVPRKNGMEVRSDDIRAATSRRLKDRSSRLPEPTAVSDSPGRPIVSFDANWKAPDESADNKAAQASTGDAHGRAGRPMGIPTIAVEEEAPPRSRQAARPIVPSIAVAGPDDGPGVSVPSINVPSIAVDEPSSVPVIVTPDDKPEGNKARPLPQPRAAGPRARGLQRPRGHWSPAPGAMARSTTACHECGFPIEGRFVALAGSKERFHPQCFSCFMCGTGLEAMEISHEPEHLRMERLERIRRRSAGEQLEEVPGMTMEEDGDERLRFYCHLDWHELFAPRCKHCKTPILGEHIVALGEHWHYGHFFCAECGDPFEHGMTHIEKDGYAWCINCQTKRTERRAPKCKKCKVAVIGQYIQALGGEWHEHCFRCAECQGGFDDGQIFPKEVRGGMVVLCTACRTRDLKA